MPEEITVSSLQGTYALTSTGWGGQVPVAALGILTFDGKGKASGLLYQSVSGDAFGERKLLELVLEGPYQINADGTVTSVTMGGTFETRLVITKTELAGDLRIAQEFSLIAKDLDPIAGNLTTTVATRLPDGGEFNNASLKGTYIGVAIGWGGQTAGAGFGIIRYDGNGGFSENNISNVQGNTFRERHFVSGSDAGKYTVNADGTGNVSNGGVFFVITRANLVDGIKVAQEYSFIVRDLIPTTGNLVTGVAKRLSD